MKTINRRDFLKLGAAGLGGLLLTKMTSVSGNLPDFPTSPRLGRVFHIVDIKTKPDPESSTVDVRFDDNIVEIKREVIGKPPSLYSTNRLWYEIPEGFIPSITVQPVESEINKPLNELPIYGDAQGMWVEVTVPYVDIELANPPARSLLLIEWQKPRFYYSQVLWVDGIKKNENGATKYHVVEKYGTEGDEFWADAQAFKPLTPEDLAPINPTQVDKRIVIDVSHQTLACFEGPKEILFTRVSTGAKYDMYGNAVDVWSTPVGDYHAINRKYASVHMAGGTAASGFELFAVSYTSIFATGGVAIHSTFWHNNYGEPMSHGCVNAKPEDAKFIFRWAQPAAPYESGLVDIQGYSGTKVQVVEY
jgi:lipoprotein-anchoring transpeptidase ErfK/SrfK